MNNDESTWCNCQAIEGTANYPEPWHERGGEPHYPCAQEGASPREVEEERRRNWKVQDFHATFVQRNRRHVVVERRNGESYEDAVSRTRAEVAEAEGGEWVLERAVDLRDLRLVRDR